MRKTFERREASVYGLSRPLRFIAAASLMYLVFGVAGQLSALALLDMAGGGDAIGSVLFGLGLAMALGTVAVARGARRAGKALPAIPRLLLAGFAAFFCWQWTVGGTPDWNPIFLLCGLVICGVCAVLVLRAGVVETN